MSAQVDAWLSHPDVHALLDRAHRYQREVYARTGAPPEWFLVTEDEYRLLLREPSCGGPVQHLDPDQMRLCGMRVCRPERMAWYHRNSSMEHYRLSDAAHRAMSACDDPSDVPIHLVRCRTERPSHPQWDIACPCGEVIWDLSTCFWDRATRDAERITPFDQMLSRLMARMAQGLYQRMRSLEPTAQAASDEPLPPLRDLDEGLTCDVCRRTHQTFADYMAHRRQHGERGL
jgi:hypothetical protein